LPQSILALHSAPGYSSERKDSKSSIATLIDTGEFIAPLNGRGRKLLFDPDAVEAWVKSRQPPMPTPTVLGTVAQRRQGQDRKRRLEAAHAALDAHRMNKSEHRGTPVLCSINPANKNLNKREEN
jgi:hypothetical protein